MYLFLEHQQEELHEVDTYASIASEIVHYGIREIWKRNRLSSTHKNYTVPEAILLMSGLCRVH